MAQTSISIRMDAELKKNFETFCGAVGMNMSTAINMFAILRARAARPVRDLCAACAAGRVARSLYGYDVERRGKLSTHGSILRV